MKKVFILIVFLVLRIEAYSRNCDCIDIYYNNFSDEYCYGHTPSIYDNMVIAKSTMQETVKDVDTINMILDSIACYNKETSISKNFYMRIDRFSNGVLVEKIYISNLNTMLRAGKYYEIPDSFFEWLNNTLNLNDFNKF